MTWRFQLPTVDVSLYIKRTNFGLVIEKRPSQVAYYRRGLYIIMMRGSRCLNCISIGDLYVRRYYYEYILKGFPI